MVIAKPFKTIPEQISILKRRKMIFPSEEFAQKILEFENYYYVINGYKEPFINSTIPDDSYRAGTTFNELAALYSFDRRLRELLLVELLRIEHYVKAQIIIVFSKYHGHDHTSYLKQESFNIKGPKNLRRTQDLIFEINKLLRKRAHKHGAIRHYNNKYGFVPLWVLSKVMTFGKLNSFYGCMLMQEKEEVAKAFKLSASAFKTILDFMADLRNKCAHDERIFCHSRDQQIPRPIPDLSLHASLKIPQNSKGYKYGKCDILALLIAMKYFLHPDRYNHLLKRIDYALQRKLASELKTINVSTIKNIMGLIGDWENLKSCPL